MRFPASQPCTAGLKWESGTGPTAFDNLDNGLTNTVLARMRKPWEWVAYATTMKAHRSVKNLAENLGIAPLTAWRWRIGCSLSRNCAKPRK